MSVFSQTKWLSVRVTCQWLNYFCFLFLFLFFKNNKLRSLISSFLLCVFPNASRMKHIVINNFLLNKRNNQHRFQIIHSVQIFFSAAPEHGIKFRLNHKSNSTIWTVFSVLMILTPELNQPFLGLKLKLKLLFSILTIDIRSSDALRGLFNNF